MQVTETSAVGLNRELKIVVPASQTTEKIDSHLNDLNLKVKVNGFRPGKVPIKVLRNMFGKRVIGEVLQDIVNDTSKKAIEERSERLAAKAEVNIAENIAESVLSGNDLIYDIRYEVMPDIKIPALSSIKVERPAVEVDESIVNDYIKELQAQNRSYESGGNSAVSESGDQLELSYSRSGEDGSISVENAEKIKVVLGNSHFFASDEDKLIGRKIGDVCELELTMPQSGESADDSKNALKISATVLDVSKPVEREINDKFAQDYGFDSLEKLKETVRSNNKGQYEQLSNGLVLEQVHDKILESCEFEVPEQILKSEIEQAMKEYNENQKEQGSIGNAAGESEEEKQFTIRKLAERKVRLHLIYATIANEENLDVSNSEMDAAVVQTAKVLNHGKADAKAVEEVKSNEQLMVRIQGDQLLRKAEKFLLSRVGIVEKFVSEKEFSELLEKYRNPLIIG